MTTETELNQDFKRIKFYNQLSKPKKNLFYVLTFNLIALGVLINIGLNNPINITRTKASASGQISLPSSITSNTGQEFQIPISVQATEPITSLDLAISFDRTALQITGLSPNQNLLYLPTDSNQELNLPKIINDANNNSLLIFGALSYDAKSNTLLPPLPENQKHTIATLTFKSLKQGSTEINVKYNTDSNSATNIITLNTENNVLASATNTNVTILEPTIIPTNTPTKSPTPTTQITIALTPTKTPTTTISSPTPTPTQTQAPTPTTTQITTPTPTPNSSYKIITRSVSEPSHDINQDGSQQNPNGTPLWIGTGQNKSNSYLALKFENINIPQGAKIISANLKLYSPSQQWINTRLRIFGHLSPDTPNFTQANLVSNLPRTKLSISSNQSHKWEANSWNQISNIQSIIQEITNQPNWKSGNSLGIIIKGTSPQWGRKIIGGADTNTNQSPTLSIEYQ